VPHTTTKPLIAGQGTGLEVLGIRLKSKPYWSRWVEAAHKWGSCSARLSRPEVHVIGVEPELADSTGQLEERAH